MAIRTLKWTDSAISDLRSIKSYIEKDSPENARNVVRRIFNKTRKLGEFPFIGHKLPERGFGSLRQLIIFKYRIIYAVSVESVSIVAIIHGARLLRKALKNRKLDGI